MRNAEQAVAILIKPMMAGHLELDGRLIREKHGTNVARRANGIGLESKAFTTDANWAAYSHAAREALAVDSCERFRLLL